MNYEPGDIVYRPMVDGRQYWALKCEIIECISRTKCDMSYLVKAADCENMTVEGRNLHTWKNRALADAKIIAIQNVIETLVQHAADREQ